VIRKARKQLLQYIRRNVGQVDGLLSEWGEKLSQRRRKFVNERLAVVKRIYEQQYRMWKEKTRRIQDRIVSLHQSHIRPIVRGKDGRDVEFGPKVLLSWVDGFCFLDYLSCDAYNEGDKAVVSLEKYRERFGALPPVTIGDGIFGTRANRQKLKELGILQRVQAAGQAAGNGPCNS